MRALEPDPLRPNTYYVGKASRKEPEDRYVFDKKTGELTSISWWRLDREGKFYEEARYTFRYWDFDLPVPRGTFDTRIPRGYHTLEELKAQRAKQLELEQKK